MTKIPRFSQETFRIFVNPNRKSFFFLTLWRAVLEEHYLTELLVFQTTLRRHCYVTKYKVYNSNKIYILFKSGEDNIVFNVQKVSGSFGKHFNWFGWIWLGMVVNHLLASNCLINVCFILRLKIQVFFFKFHRDLFLLQGGTAKYYNYTDNINHDLFASQHHLSFGIDIARVSHFSVYHFGN